MGSSQIELGFREGVDGFSGQGDVEREEGFWWRSWWYVELSERWDFLRPLLQPFSAVARFIAKQLFQTCSLLISASSSITFKIFCHSFLVVAINIRASVFQIGNCGLAYRISELRCIPREESDSYEVVKCELRASLNHESDKLWIR